MNYLASELRRQSYVTASVHGTFRMTVLNCSLLQRLHRVKKIIQFVLTSET